MNLLNIFQSEAIKGALTEAVVEQYGSQDAVIQALADQLGIVAITGRYAEECIAARDRELNESETIAELRDELQRTRDANLRLSNELAVARSELKTEAEMLTLKNGDIVVLATTSRVR